MEHKVLNKTIYIDGNTGLFAFDRNILNEMILRSGCISFDKLKIDYSDYKTSFVTFCINLSNSCNLSCDYCFNLEKNNRSISLQDSLNFLDTCFSLFPDKEKYYIDLSGKGEPLLFLDKILKIKEYCDNKSNELNREILVQFVCNGTLLDPVTANVLQVNGILFGVSLDGNAFIHDKHRKTKDGNPTYDVIMNNINGIPHHEYVGAACTLTNDVFSLKDSIVELSKTFNTVSYKPSRDCVCAIDECSINKWLESYDELTLFLVEQTIRGNLRYIKVLLNGDDYFGKFIKRMMLGQRNIIRCDAGISRFTLDEDGFVYTCPASFGRQEFRVGTKDCLSYKRSSKIFKTQIKKVGCNKCDFRNICGGECLIERILSNGVNKIMCKYKSHLILLAMYFVECVFERNSLSFEEIKQFCIEIDNRRKLDKKLMVFLEGHQEYNFIEGKKVFDEREKRY